MLLVIVGCCRRWLDIVGDGHLLDVVGDCWVL